jgi:hypothetical protein
MPLLLDGLVSVLLLVYLASAFWGGIEWHGHTMLRHGADPRRAAILALVLGAWLCRAYRERGSWPRVARAAGSRLAEGSARGRRLRWGLLAGAWIVAGAVSVLQCLAMRTPLYDVGLFHQILWALAHGHGFLSTVSGAGDFLRDHLSPSLALLVPAYWLGASSPLTLAVVQPALLFGGAAAWLWLAERVGRAWLAASAAVFGACFESLWGNLNWGFHENAIAFAATSWALALWLAPSRAAPSPRARGFDGRRLAAAALLLITAFSKEILLVDVAIACLVWGWIDGQAGSGRAWIRRLGACAAALGLIAVFVAFERLPHPADKNYFDRYYAYLGHGLGDFARSLALKPWLVIENVGARELGRYLVTVFLPWFPLVWAWRVSRRELGWLAMILPSLASAALATYAPLRQASFHYVLELWPALACVTIMTLARLAERGGETRARAWAVAWAGLALLAWDHDPIAQLREYARGAVEAAPVRAAIASIPASDGILGDELCGPWISGREIAARWPSLDGIGGRCPRWVVLRSVEQLELTRRVCGSSRPFSENEIGSWRLLIYN